MTDVASGEVDALLRSDFQSFLAMVFATLCPAEPFCDNWHLEVLAYQLEQVRTGNVKRLITNVPPRSLKSIAISVAWPAFLLGHNPSLKILAASYGQELAAKLSRDTRSVMEAEWYRRIFPSTTIQGKDTETQFETSAHGSRRATSIGGPMTGFGADVIIIDDPHKAEDANSEAARKKTRDWYEQTLSTRLNNKNTGAIVLVMQRLHEDDLSGHLLEQGEWTHLNIPAIAPFDCSYRFGPGPGDFLEVKAGTVIDARRESRATLASLEKSMGTRAFSAQYLQSPVPVGGNLLEWPWFKFYDPAKRPITSFPYVFQSWDPAVSENLGADYSVCTTWGVDNDNCAFLIDLWRGRRNFPDLIKWALHLEEKFKPDAVVVEAVGSGQSFYQELHRHLADRIQWHVPKESKIVRASAITPSLERGEVFLPKDAKWLEPFRNEIIAFPLGKNDDQVDSFVQMIAHRVKLVHRCRARGLTRLRAAKGTKFKEIEVPVPAGAGRLVCYSTKTVRVEVVDA
jgi:predicted phage terminase large subunit-like protein